MRTGYWVIRGLQRNTDQTSDVRDAQVAATKHSRFHYSTFLIAKDQTRRRANESTDVPDCCSHNTLSCYTSNALRRGYASFLFDVQELSGGEGGALPAHVPGPSRPKKTPNLQMWYFSTSFSYPQVSPSHSYRVTLTLLLLSVSSSCENSNMEGSFLGTARPDGAYWVRWDPLPSSGKIAQTPCASMAWREVVVCGILFFIPPLRSPPHLNFNRNVNITAVIILSKYPKSKRRVVQLKQIYSFSHCNLPPSSGHGAKHVCVVLTSHSNKEVEMITRVSRQSFSCMLYH